MDGGSVELTRATTAYLVALGFALTFLLAQFLGAGLGTGLFRAVLVAGALYLVAPHFVRPVITSILDAMARDQQAAQASEPAPSEEDSP